MKKKEKLTVPQRFRITETEEQRIKRKMEAKRIRTKSDYWRGLIPKK